MTAPAQPAHHCGAARPAPRIRRVLLGTASALLALPAISNAQTCRTAADINKIRAVVSSFPEGPPSDNGRVTATRYVRCSGLWYFRAWTCSAGQELWRTDGTRAGTRMVKDIWPGVDSGLSRSFPTEMPCCVVGGRELLFFAADDGVHGVELWRTDGTEAGTVMVRDIRPGREGSSPWSFACLRGKVYFGAVDAAKGFELWSSDGTAAGTVLVKDINPGPTGGFPRYMTLSSGGDELYFQAWGGVAGIELWKTRGTAATTTRVADIRPGAGSSAPRFFQRHRGATLFVANGPNGDEVWRTDGTAAGTFELRDIFAGSRGSSPRLQLVARVGTDMFFAAQDPTNGAELWKTDGTRAGTVLAADILPGRLGSAPSGMFAAGSTLYFAAKGSSAQGIELWKHEAGRATLVKDIAAGAASSAPSRFVALGREVLFAAGDAAAGYELWATDGTAAGTRLVKDVDPGTASGSPAWTTPLSATAVMFRGTDAARGAELWITDGTTAGTRLLADIEPAVGSRGSSPSAMAAHGGNSLYFRADDGMSGFEPYVWRSGRPATRLIDAAPGRGSSFAFGFTSCDELVFFSAEERAVTGREPFVTDGTPGGTRMLRDIRAGAAGSDPRDFTCLGERVLFRADDGVNGIELWGSDGTPAGTALVKDILTGSANGFPTSLTFFRGRVYFAANDAARGRELWVSDGTAAGTVMVRDIRPGSGSSNVSGITVHGGWMYFSANDGTTGVELWRSDGTAAGTSLVRDIVPGPSGSGPSRLISCGDKLAFRAFTPATGTELWASDGTGPGTALVEDIWPGTRTSLFLSLFCCNGRVYTAAYDGVHGRELWVSDLTPAGTRMVKDIRPGARGSEPGHITCVGDRVYFTADDDARRGRLWVTDGTEAGTREACKLGPRQLVPMGGVLYASAAPPGAKIGEELVAITGAGPMVEHLGPPCSPSYATLTATPPRLGTTAMLIGAEGPARNPGVILLAAPPRAPVRLPLLRSDCRSYTSMPLGVLGTVTAPRWHVPVAIPNLPSLEGATAVAQACYLVPVTVYPASTTNAVQMTLGR